MNTFANTDGPVSYLYGILFIWSVGRDLATCKDSYRKWGASKRSELVQKSSMCDKRHFRKQAKFDILCSLAQWKKTELNEVNEESKTEAVKPVRYKPIPVDQLARETKYSTKEVKFLYRAFKQECPTGISNEETFKEIYQTLFPLGDSSKYASLVFRSIDQDHTGGITFGDFMDFLSVLTKGSTKDKIVWCFNFYDTNRDGVISLDDLLKVG